ncbi:queuosine precursor transporter [Limoniibacter endophyticus]|uniref:Probable queuosine precursor transporter n=1 Tax=Limoniibacter endophyticus TaxID=1565040 RepID=A0A8J3GI70_9HYPH|nr:queuosine precursor transporter [Limoniibacter endophyticus]GHC76373.1 membrane protein [Limoniibacter endophyticus]
MSRATSYTPYIFAMTLVVVISNFLVQFPIHGQVGALQLADVLTWGAFAYPLAFLVTDLVNRIHGPKTARRIVFIGFAVAVTASIIAPKLLYATGWLEFEMTASRIARIAIASGTAFLIAQLLDVTVFNWLRKQDWWRAPVFGSLSGSIVDTTIFFSVAFAPVFGFVGAGEPFALENSPLLGLMAMEAPRWVSWALGDFLVKLAIAVVALIPYRLIVASYSRPTLA